MLIERAKHDSGWKYVSNCNNSLRSKIANQKDCTTESHGEKADKDCKSDKNKSYDFGLYFQIP